MSERTVGDLLHPARPGRPTTAVNAVSQSVSMDVAPWRFERIMQFYAGLERDAERQRNGPSE